MTSLLMSLFWITLFAGCVTAQCPHPDFLQKNICDSCHSRYQAINFANTAGLKGMVTGQSRIFNLLLWSLVSLSEVLGPPLDTFPPLFRKIGPGESDFCVNRQPRAAYRCNMDSKRAYCFRLGTACYAWHDPMTGIPHKTLRLATVNCQDNFAWTRQHLLEDYDTDRSNGGPRYD